MNPLMQSMQPQNNMQSLMNIARMLKKGNPEQIAMNLMQKNPQFKAFMDSVQGMTPEQYCREHGIDFGQIAGMM